MRSLYPAPPGTHPARAHTFGLTDHGRTEPSWTPSTTAQRLGAYVRITTTDVQVVVVCTVFPSREKCIQSSHTAHTELPARTELTALRAPTQRPSAPRTSSQKLRACVQIIIISGKLIIVCTLPLAREKVKKRAPAHQRSNAQSSNTHSQQFSLSLMTLKDDFALQRSYSLSQRGCCTFSLFFFSRQRG